MTDRTKSESPPVCAYDGAVGSSWEACAWRPSAMWVWVAETVLEVRRSMERRPRLRWDWGGR